MIKAVPIETKNKNQTLLHKAEYIAVALQPIKVEHDADTLRTR